jgi:hypothetical protein
MPPYILTAISRWVVSLNGTPLLDRSTLTILALSLLLVVLRLSDLRNS